MLIGNTAEYLEIMNNGNKGSEHILVLFFTVFLFHGKGYYFPRIRNLVPIAMCWPACPSAG